MLEIANLIAVVGGETTAHGVRQIAIRYNCGIKGNNTLQIVYTGNSSSRRLSLLDVSMDFGLVLRLPSSVAGATTAQHQ